MTGARAGFTTRGSCLLAAGITALLCGIGLGETDLSRVGVLLIALPVVAAVVVRRGRVSLANRRDVSPPQVSAGDGVVVTLDVVNRSVLPTGTLLLEDELPPQLDGRARFVLDGLAGKAERTISYRLAGLVRGRYPVGPLRVHLADPFGVAQVRHSFTAVSELVVAPVVEVLPPFEPPRVRDLGADAGSSDIGSNGADAATTREYRTGDPLRKVHWRSTARTARLMVRQEEQPWQGSATLLIDLRAGAHRRGAVPEGPVRDPRQYDSMEWALSAAASIGIHLLLAGQRFGIISDPRASTAAYPGSPAGLRELLADAGPNAEPTLAPVRDLLHRVARGGSVTAVLGGLDPQSLQLLASIDGRAAYTPPMALLLDTATWAVSAAGGPGRRSATCTAAATALRQAGWHVAIAARGDSVTAAWQRLALGRVGAGAPL